MAPLFHGIQLVLMNSSTPPDKLLEHISALEKGIDAASGQCTSTPLEPPQSAELETLLTPEALFQWNYPLFRLSEVCTRPARRACRTESTRARTLQH